MHQVSHLLSTVLTTYLHYWFSMLEHPDPLDTLRQKPSNSLGKVYVCMEKFSSGVGEHFWISPYLVDMCTN